jgi:hypothetical protein
MAATKTKVSKKVQRMLVAGIGKIFNVNGDVTGSDSRTGPRWLREENEAHGIHIYMDIRFLGIDADEPDEIVGLFSCEWEEDGFPTCRIMQFSDDVMARLSIFRGDQS